MGRRFYLVWSNLSSYDWVGICGDLEITITSMCKPLLYVDITFPHALRPSTPTNEFGSGVPWLEDRTTP